MSDPTAARSRRREEADSSSDIRFVTSAATEQWSGYRRPDGRKGVRNLVLVIYTVECAQHVAHAIAAGEKRCSRHRFFRLL